MTLKEMLIGVPIFEIFDGAETDILGMAYSSKAVKPGYLFAALKGEKTDGFDFLNDALEKGAAAVLSERPCPKDFSKAWVQVTEPREALAIMAANFYRHPSLQMKVVGITGTKGKTTVTYLLEQIFRQAGLSTGVIGTIAYRGPGLDLPAELTTPEAPNLQRMLRSIVDSGATHCLMEVSSHALDLNRVQGIEFDVAVFTNLSGEHLDYHHTMADYFEAKKRLFVLGQKNKMAVINADDPWGKKLIKELPIGVITYGLNSSSFILAEDYDLSEQGIKASVQYPGGRMDISSPLLGKPNLYNILASIAASLTLSLPVSAIEQGISALKGVPGRLEKIENSRGLYIFVDYAHTDDALKKLLETARELCRKRVILVFGAGGDRDKSKRPRMGEVAGALADWTIITSDNPRSEYPMDIISDIEKGIRKTGPTKYEVRPNRRTAIQRALALAKKDDCILVAGKGHEGYQIIRDRKIPFKDTDVIRSLLRERKRD